MTLRSLGRLLALFAAICAGGFGAAEAWVSARRRARVSVGRARVATMSGSWRGEYAYDFPGYDPVPFNAEMTEREGVLAGRIDEPNTFGDPAADRLFAALAGSRSGSAVFFLKTYDGSGGQTHAVAYEGEIDAEGARIDGRWRAGVMAGPFFMERDASAALSEAVSRAAEAGG